MIDYKTYYTELRTLVEAALEQREREYQSKHSVDPALRALLRQHDVEDDLAEDSAELVEEVTPHECGFADPDVVLRDLAGEESK